MPKHLLTELAVKNAKPRATAYRLRDGDGLFLFVPPSGVRSWQFRYELAGRQQTATLGKVDSMSLAEAREKAGEARKLAERGEHVTAAKRVAKAASIAATSATFGPYTEAWVKAEHKRARWTEDYRGEVAASLANHLSGLNPLPIAALTAAVCAPHLRRCERKAPDMALKVRQRLRAILDAAVEDGIIPANPLPVPRRRKRGAQRQHLPAVLDRAGVGAILRAADVAELSRGVRRAHLLATFLAQRIGEIVPAEWAEFDLDAGVWSIPRSRMKRKDQARGNHEVPLPPTLLVLMKEWKRSDGAGVYACPAPLGDGYVTREAIEKLYRRKLELTGKHSPHSWRSVFSTWAREAGKDGDVIEAQLDHVVGNKVSAAYDRAKRLELRRELVAWYERELIGARDGAEVVQLLVKRPA